MTGILIRGKFGYIDSQERTHVKTEEEVGLMCQQAKEC